jgi:hypothetical protein
MAGEEGSFDRRITKSMSASKRAAKEAVSGDEESLLTRCHLLRWRREYFFR